MTAEEANELEGLGEVLKSLETELKTIESNEPNTVNELDSTEVEDANKQKSPEMTEPQQSNRTKRPHTVKSKSKEDEDKKSKETAGRKIQRNGREGNPT